MRQGAHKVTADTCNHNEKRLIRLAFAGMNALPELIRGQARRRYAVPIRTGGHRVKKWIALPLLALLALLAWIAAGPFMTIHAIREAIQAQDSAELSRHVDFPLLRQSLRAQVEDALARRVGAQVLDSPLGGLALGLANQAAGGMVDAIATPAGIGAILEGRGLVHRISGGGISKDDAYAHQPPPDPLRDARYRFETPSRFTATVHTADGAPVVFVLLRQGMDWKLADIRLPPPTPTPPQRSD